MNKQEATRIAGAISHLRPDWHANGLMTVLADERLRDRPYADIVRVFVALALDPSSKRPTRIYEAGDWWDAARRWISSGPDIPHGRPDDCDICHRPKEAAHMDHDYTPRDAYERAPMPESLRKQLTNPTHEENRHG